MTAQENVKDKLIMLWSVIIRRILEIPLPKISRSMRKTIAVIGDSRTYKDSISEILAFELGAALVDNGYRVLTGGRGGVMEATMRGAKSSVMYHEGDTIAILPSFDSESANPYADIVIPTGLDIMRNGIIANSDAVIAIGGGAGTLSEMAYAWTMKRLIIGYINVQGWSAKLAGLPINHRKRYKGFEDIVHPSASAQESINLLKKYGDRYKLRHKAIK